MYRPGASDVFGCAFFIGGNEVNENSKCKEMCFRADGSHDGAHFLWNFDTGLRG